MTNLDSILKSRNVTLLTKVHMVKTVFFPVVMYGCESWTIKKAECQRIDAFELRCWRGLLKVLWKARRSNQEILKEINPEYSLEGLMLKLNVVVKQSRREFWLNDKFRKRRSSASRPSAQERLRLNVKFVLKRSNNSRSPKSPTRRNRSLLPPNRNNSPRQKRVLTLHSQKQ